MRLGYDDDLRERIGANLAAFDRVALAGDALARAAVAVVLVDCGDGEAGYLFTQRSFGLRRNGGQYALPGGRLDAGESVADAARRELAEELGVALPAGGLLGLLDDMPTRTGFAMTPVVWWAGGEVELRPDPTEVHDAWVVPLAELDHPDAPRRIADPQLGHPILRMPVRGEWINPPTAAVLYQLREVALYGRTVRVADVVAPMWTSS